MRTVKDTNSPPWIDNEVRRLIRKKYKALNQYRVNRSADRKRKLRSVTQQIKCMIRSKRQGYLAKIESSLCDNPKMFWSYHKSIFHQRTGQANVITYNGVTANTAKEKANIFNAYFSSVFRPPSIPCNYMPRTESEESISEITLDVDEVVQFLRDLDTSKACGSDGIPPRIIQECALEIAPIICVLFNRSLHTGNVLSGNQQMSLPSIKKISRNLQNITDQYPCCPSSEKFWSVACASGYMIMFSTLSQKRSMASSDGDLALLNYYQYYTPSDSPWTKTSKLTSSISILQKHSTLSITKFFSTSLRRMVCQASFMIGLWTISVVVVKK